MAYQKPTPEIIQRCGPKPSAFNRQKTTNWNLCASGAKVDPGMGRNSMKSKNALAG